MAEVLFLLTLVFVFFCLYDMLKYLKMFNMMKDYVLFAY